MLTTKYRPSRRPSKTPETPDGAFLQSLRLSRGLSRGDLGERCHLSQRILEEIEWGNRKLTRRTIEKLHAALQFTEHEREQVVEIAIGLDITGRPRSPSEATQVVSGPSSARVEDPEAVSQSRQEALLHLWEPLSDEQRLTHLFHQALQLNTTGPALALFRGELARLFEKYGQISKPSAQERQLLARTHLIAGASYGESETELFDIARQHLQKARQYAKEVDPFCYFFGLWLEGVFWRKTANVTDDSNDYDKARYHLEDVIEGHSSDDIKACSLMEESKVALWLKDKNSFEISIGLAERKATDFSPSAGSVGDGSWPPSMGDYALVHVHTTRLMSLAAFLEDIGKMNPIIKDAVIVLNRLPYNLEVLEHASLNLGMGERLLKSNDRDDHIKGYKHLRVARHYIKKTRLRKQAFNYRKILSDELARNNYELIARQISPADRSLQTGLPS